MVDVIIMAAGKGTRMKSRLPKVLHRLAGRALLQHVVDTAARLLPRHVVVVTGHGAEPVEAALRSAVAARRSSIDPGGGVAEPDAGFVLDFARQEPQLGTGHAVQQALPWLEGDGIVLVLSGDVPLTRASTLRALVAAAGAETLALLTIDFADPTGYGRILRSPDGAVQQIVEQKDATEAQRAIREVYSGIMALPACRLRQWLERLDKIFEGLSKYLAGLRIIGDGRLVLFLMFHGGLPLRIK